MPPENETQTTELNNENSDNQDSVTSENNDAVTNQDSAANTGAENSDPSTGEGDTQNQDKGQNDADGKSVTDDAPETYADFDLPEGMPLDEKLLESAVPVFKELNLTQEQAQKLVDFQANQVQASQDAAIDSFNQMKADWLNQAKTDKEIGGDSFDENVGTAKLFIKQFGTEELRNILDETGVGNHPEVIRAFANAGKFLKEDAPGDQNNSVTQTPKNETEARIQRMYGSGDTN